MKKEQVIDSALLHRFIEAFPIPKGNKTAPYIILLDGLTGMGKSTVAKQLSQLDGSIILNNDEVRYFLGDYQDTTQQKEALQNYRLQKLLENHNSCIYDRCFCHNYKEKLNFYQQLGYPYYILRLECSDEVVKERLFKRCLDGENFSIATYEGYLWMKENVPRVPQTLIDFTIDTEKEIVPQLIQFLTQFHLR